MRYSTGKKEYTSYQIYQWILTAKDGQKMAIPQIDGDLIIVTVTRKKGRQTLAEKIIKGER